MGTFISTGIAGVNNLRFCPSFKTIMWDPPPNFGVLGGLSYHLTVTNMNTGVVIINTTITDTSYRVGVTQPCTNYSASVTAFSGEYTGVSTSIIDSFRGGEC